MAPPGHSASWLILLNANRLLSDKQLSMAVCMFGLLSILENTVRIEECP